VKNYGLYENRVSPYELQTEHKNIALYEYVSNFIAS